MNRLKGLWIASCGALLLLAGCSANEVAKTEENGETETSVSEEKMTEAQQEAPEKMEEHEHEHEEGISHHDELPYEWSGTFELLEGSYELILRKNEFGDETMAVAFLLEGSNIHDLEHHAAHLMEAESEDVHQKSQFLATHEYVYNLYLNPTETSFSFFIEQPGSYVLFFEHDASEFDMQIMNANGEEVVPTNVTEYEGHHHHDHD